MADIFISYRHGTTDSWAADDVAKRLEQHFSVFLDGRRGLVFHVLQGFWFRFLVDAMSLERRRRAEGAQ